MTHACTKDISELAIMDEVVAFALRMQKAREAEEEYEVIKSRAKRENNVSVETYSESAMFQHGDTAEAARNMLSVVTASTLAGAAIQICDAINRIDWSTTAPATPATKSARSSGCSTPLSLSSRPARV